MPDNDAKLKLVVQMEQDEENATAFTAKVAEAVRAGVEQGLSKGFEEEVAVTLDLGVQSSKDAAGEAAAESDRDRVEKEDVKAVVEAIGKVGDDLDPMSESLRSINDSVRDIATTLGSGNLPDSDSVADLVTATDELGKDAAETKGIVQRILDWFKSRRKKGDPEESGEEGGDGKARSLHSDSNGGFPIILPDIFGRIGDWLGNLFNFGKKKGEGVVAGPGPEEYGKDEEDKDDTKFSEKWSPIIMKGVSLGTQGLKSIADTSLGFVSSIYRYMKQSSPLLQSVESLFNLAMTLFFLPLGTKLAEEILPATLDMIDDIADMWDSFEGKTLGEIASDMVAEGAKIFGEYFQDIGESLSEQTGVIGTIGNLMVDIGNFIENKGEKFIDTLLDIAELIISNFKEFVSLYIALKGVEIGASLGSSIPIVGSLIGGLLGGTILGGLSYGALTSWGFAEGGYVPATEGGAIARIAEAGEGEYIVPESKAKDFAEGVTGKSGNTYNISISGYTDSELKRYVTDIVNEQVAFSRLKGSF